MPLYRRFLVPLGDDGDAAVDGVHATDLGFTRMANTITPVIERALDDIGK